MDLILASYIRDPLYRLAIWIIFFQFSFILAAAFIAGIIRWFKPQLESKRKREEQQARNMLLEFLSKDLNEVEEDEANAVQLFNQVSIRALITTFEQVATRLGEVEQRRLRASVIALWIETYALKLASSWWWWRRFEGVLLLRSVGTLSSEDRLVELLNDKHPTVSFYSAWALARVSPIRGLDELIHYIDLGGQDQVSKSNTLLLSFSQQVTLLKELQLQYLKTVELEALFERLSDQLKPVLIEALIQSSRGQALPIVRLGIISTNIEIRIASFKAAATSRLSLSETELARGLSDPIWPVRAQAVKVVGVLRILNLIPQVCQCLSDGQWWVRYNSAHTLVQLGAAGVEALSYISQFGDDRFARDMARLILSEAIMGQNQSVMSALDTQPISPLPQSQLSAEGSLILHQDRPNSLLTTELTILSNLEKK
jgi:hypothetical protein